MTVAKATVIADTPIILPRTRGGNTLNNLRRLHELFFYVSIFQNVRWDTTGRVVRNSVNAGRRPSAMPRTANVHVPLVNMVTGVWPVNV